MCYRPYFFFLVILFFTSLGCHTHIPEYEQGPITLQLSHLGGSVYEHDSRFYLPYPLDHGTLESDGLLYDVFVMGSGMSNLGTVGVSPFREMEYTTADGDISRLIIAYPTDHRLSIGMSDDVQISDTQLYPMIHMLEYWYIHRDGLNGRYKITERNVTHRDYTITQ